ncbi:MAG: HAD family hydrolase [Acidimicrobiales bacterium]
MAVRLVATDLDGTFLRPDGTVSDRARAAVRRARSAGIDVIPVTARAPWSTRRIAEAGGLGPLAVCGNGAVVYDLDAATVLDHVTLPGDVAARLVTAVRAAVPGIRFACETIDELVPELGLFDAEAARAWLVDLSGPVADVLQHLGPAVTKLICRHPDRLADDGDQLLDEVAAACGADGTVTSAGTGWAEIGAPGVTKAFALERVCDRLGLPAADVLCVGDSLNDVPMLAWAGTPVAVANARPEVLAVAERVVAANGEDGVAQLLEELAAGVRRAGGPPPSGTARGGWRAGACAARQTRGSPPS